jgi:hypothetical protein
MLGVVVGADVIRQLPSRSTVLSAGLTDHEWAHLAALPGVCSTARSDARGTGATIAHLT